MKRMKQKEYVFHHGHYCPVCNSTQITSDVSDPNLHWGVYEYPMECTGCGSVWWELLKLSGYKIIKKGKKVA
jgi:uncharacterized protein with PIN domain